MFLQQEDMPLSMYGYLMDQITEGNEDIVIMAMAAAEEEVRSYLTGNNMREWQDGRLHYDADAILRAVGDQRNPLILKHAITIAKWWVVELCNAEIIYEQVKERYDRSINWLSKLSKGDINLSSLPLINEDSVTDEKQPFSFGSRTKFNHE